MSLRKMTTAVLAAAGMLVLILDGQTALLGAAAGLELCIKTVIPSLFPFLFLCSLLTGSLWGSDSPWLRAAGKKLGIPAGAESLLLVALLGGYPAGAQTIGENYHSGRLSREDAVHLLTFCSNAGPAFLFGMVSRQFPEAGMVWALWIIQILSALLTGMLGGGHAESAASLAEKTGSVSQTLTQTVKTMGIVCGWILLLRILGAFLERWIFWIFPLEIQIIFTGLLELSNGCCALSQISSLSLRFLVCSGFLSFGGLCVVMQTASVIGSLPLKPYLLGKLTQTAISLLLSALYLHRGWPLLAAAGICILLFPAGVKKRGRFPLSSGV